MREMVKLAKREALATVKAHVNPEWFNTAVTLAHDVAAVLDRLTSDEVWVELCVKAPHLPFPHENRAMGAVMQEAAKRGFIEATDTYTPSTRKVCHGRPVRVWRSKVHGAPLLFSKEQPCTPSPTPSSSSSGPLVRYLPFPSSSGGDGRASSGGTNTSGGTTARERD